MRTKISVITSNKVEGFHFYPDAPDTVKFLSTAHRHIFHIRMWFEVFTADRQKEIFIQQWEIANYINAQFKHPANFGSLSCEEIARNLLNQFADENAYKAEVLEDGEGGAVVEL